MDEQLLGLLRLRKQEKVEQLRMEMKGQPVSNIKILFDLRMPELEALEYLIMKEEDR